MQIDNQREKQIHASLYLKMHVCGPSAAACRRRASQHRRVLQARHEVNRKVWFFTGSIKGVLREFYESYLRAP